MAQATTSPRLASRTRVDVTDWPTGRLPERARDNRIRGAEMALERRGGRTYLIADPTA